MNQQQDTVREKVYVIGHRNPDTDSICSAIAYAKFREATGAKAEYIPCRAGLVNEETKFVLDLFDVESPQYIDTVQPEIADIDLNRVAGLKKSDSIKRAWDLMNHHGTRSAPILSEGRLEGIVSITDIAQSYMDKSDSRMLAEAKTKFSSIAETLNGHIVCGQKDEAFKDGKVTIAAATPDIMEEFIESQDLVIAGNRFETHFTAIELGARCLIMCQGSMPTQTIQKLAEERGCVIISTPYDTFTTARLINQSIPVSFFMTHENIVTFRMGDSLADVEDIMKTNRFHNFPVLDSDGTYMGFISRRRLLNMHRKKVVLVDHNEITQAVDGIQQAEVLEIIDHHRLGGFETLGPVYFRNQPVGCTATIIAQMYHEAGVVPDSKTAGLLASAIISDTLMFKSPTCTPADVETCRQMAETAGIDIEKTAAAMFEAGSSLQGKTPEELCYRDFKIFSNEGYNFGVSQISSLDKKEFDSLRYNIEQYLSVVMKAQELDMMFMMMTDIASTSTELLCCGPMAQKVARKAFDIPENEKRIILKGIVSRKKQFLPAFAEALHEAE
ncbi:MAG TPA: putative manganese-dependent inorganic diphosphatase [Candidatus Copromorpha excrementigallinarum]|uniref:inorganic diphosphatase n=1 Tax=Candidatus Allocopromorpha excrementigallinarum TaxID=2840742 RepID=A0A9D1L7T9_9FIRM|nr:putative manganese-dependent inorganic diphosphatase [Candidatus Copromorpha excrementigallinarum]